MRAVITMTGARTIHTAPTTGDSCDNRVMRFFHLLLPLVAVCSCDMYAEGVVAGDPSDQAYAGDNDDYPDDAYIASLEPEYYDGHATYWYHGGWRYRDGGRWSTYRTEPAGLRQARMRNNAAGASSSRKSTSHGGGGGHSSGGHSGGGHR